MKNIISYIASFITSILLVLSLLATLIMTVVMNFASPDKLYDITKEKNLSQIVYNELDKYYSQRYNTTGIPADVYMNAISEDYINDVIRTQIDNGFYALIGQEQSDRIINTTLENALNDFYSDYADSIGAEKDAKYDEKLSEAKANADEIITRYCDVFKFNEMENHGILQKISPLYNKINTIMLIFSGADVFLALLLLLINIKSTKITLYWLGASSLISGIISVLPCLYLKATDYFSAFTIKQPQIYSAYTSTMNEFIGSLIANSLLYLAIGAVFMVIYTVLVKCKKNINNT